MNGLDEFFGVLSPFADGLGDAIGDLVGEPYCEEDRRDGEDCDLSRVHKPAVRERVLRGAQLHPIPVMGKSHDQREEVGGYKEQPRHVLFHRFSCSLKTASFYEFAGSRKSESYIILNIFHDPKQLTSTHLHRVLVFVYT